MLPLELDMFQALNASVDTHAGVVAAARWISQSLPLAMAAWLAAIVALGTGRQRRAVWSAFAGMALAWVGAQALRHGVQAPRPAQLGLGMQWIDHAARAGFPSLHAAGAFALAAALSLGRMPWAAGVAWTAALAIAWSRVCLGVHFPSDVLAGALTGMLGAWAAHRAGMALDGFRTETIGSAALLQQGPLLPRVPAAECHESER